VKGLHHLEGAGVDGRITLKLTPYKQGLEDVELLLIYSSDPNSCGSLGMKTKVSFSVFAN
jgi:hypothetical protein